MLFGFLLTLTVSAQVNSPDPFAGNTYRIDNYVGDHFENSEDLIFSNGQVEGSICIQYGFYLVDYTAWQNEADVWEFSCSMVSEEHGKMDWKGIQSEDGISGSYVWIKAGQDPIDFTFTGKLKQAEKDNFPIKFNP